MYFNQDLIKLVVVVVVVVINFVRLGTIFRYYLDMPDLEWTCATCALPPLNDSFFAEDSIEEPLITTEESEVSQSTQRFQEKISRLNQEIFSKLLSLF